jgi:hypothetical protein
MMTFPIYGKSFKIPWFQSPPTRVLTSYWDDPPTEASTGTTGATGISVSSRLELVAGLSKLLLNRSESGNPKPRTNSQDGDPVGWRA